MEKEGVVIKRDNGIIRVAVRRMSSCSGTCKTCSGCDTPEVILDLPNEVNAEVGDIVSLKANSQSVLFYTFLLYAIPIVFALAGLLVSYYFLSKSQVSSVEALSILTGLICLIISALVIKRIDKTVGEDKSSFVKVGQVIGSIVK